MFDYNERFYNATRCHSTIGYLSPVEFERKAGLGRRLNLKLIAALGGGLRSCRSLTQIFDGLSECTTRKARVPHDVVFFGRGKCCMTEEVLGTAHVDRVFDGPKGCCGVPETMQIDAESKGFLGSLVHGDIDGVGPHGDAVM